MVRSPVFKLLVWLAIVLVGGALLAPVLFAGGQWLLGVLPRGETGFTEWLAAEIGRADFARYFNRAVLVVALLTIWPLIRWARFDRSIFPPWRPAGRGLGEMGVGFALAAGLLLALGAWYAARGVYLVRKDAPWLAVGAALFPALSVAVVEEFFFRGGLLGLLLRSLRERWAVAWGVFLFAVVHFMKPPEGVAIPDAEVAWHSGFRVIGQIFGHFGHLDFLLAEFATLCAVGWVLVLARLRTGRLWAGIGLHAGWVFGLKYFSSLTRGSKELRAGEWLPWIGTNLKIGLVPLVVVLLTGWLVLWLARRWSPGPLAEDSKKEGTGQAPQNQPLTPS